MILVTISILTGARVVCPWGDKGAAGIDSEGTIFRVPAYPPPGGVIDTIGAGDTFVAATIASLSLGCLSFQQAVESGCKVAGVKVGIQGFDVSKAAKNLVTGYESINQ